MKARLFTTMLSTLLTVGLFAGDLDGYWRTADRDRDIEIMYTTHGIKVRASNRSSSTWDAYTRYDNNKYKDQRGNCFSLYGNTLEWCTADRRTIINYSRYTNDGRHDAPNDYRDDRNRDGDYRSDRDQDQWRQNDRNGWNNYYRTYEGKWHNHSTGTHIHVDLSRKSLKIKFHGERWYEVFERNQGLFVDKRGNEFKLRGDQIEYRSSDGDLFMKFYCDDRCDHREDYRSDYWR